MPRIAAIILLGGLSAAPSLADHRPAYVLPHRSGAPIIVDGLDVSGAFVEGDWGLYRPGAGSVTVVPGMGPPVPAAGRYFPATGRVPRYGRHEVEPAPGRRWLPAPAYRRSWHSDSRDGDSGAPFPEAEPLPPPPPVIEAEPRDRLRHRPRPRPRR